MRFNKLHPAVALAFFLSLPVSFAQTNRTWTGSASTDWFNPANWSPTGVPASNDTVNITNGTINLTAPVIIGGQFNWTGGMMTNYGMTIASNATMNITGPASLFLAIPLTNAGTVVWSNATTLQVLNNAGQYGGLIENESGALFDIQCDQSIYNGAAGPAYLHNAGTLRKSASTGATYIPIPVYNSGVVTGQQGTLNLNGGGTLAGTFAAGSGASVLFSGGNFTNSGPVAINGPGAVSFTSGSLTLLTDVISNLSLTGGTVNLGPAFQGGTITNLTISGATLAGTNTVTGFFNWIGGTISGGSLTVANNALMLAGGNASSLFLEVPLTNAGTVVWTNQSTFSVLNGAGMYYGLVENLTGGLFDIQCDQSMLNGAAGPAYLHNAGTLRKSANTGSTYISIPIYNSGLVTGLEGTLNLSGGGTVAGTFAAGSGANVFFSGGSFTNSGPVAISGPGAVSLTGATLTLLSDTITNLSLNGGAVNLGPAFQGGTITNLTISGATLTGTNTVTGFFNWIGGTISGGSLTVSSNALMLAGGNASSLFLEVPLTNAGTVVWTNQSTFSVLNGAGMYYGLVENLTGGLFDIQCDQSMLNGAAGPAYLHNAGTLRKSANTGATYIAIPVFNSGTVTNMHGTLNLTGGGPLTGIYGAAAGSTLNFGGGSFSNSGPVTITGSGTIQFSGGSLDLLSDTITNLPLTGGTVNLGPAFQGGNITNLTIAGSTLAGTNTVTGTFNWNGGTISGGPLTVASNGVMHMGGNATTLYLEVPLTNAGTVTWSNNNSTLLVLNNSGNLYSYIQNLPGALFDIQCDQAMMNTAGTNAYFYNAGTLQKSAQTGTTFMDIPVTNTGTINAFQGNLEFFNGFTPVGGALMFGMSGAAAYGTMTISGAATLGGSAGVVWLNGFVPAYGNVFKVLSYGSYTGGFTNYILPPAAIWLITNGPTSLTFAIGSINKVAFTTQPASGEITNQVLPPVIVQVEDPTGNPVSTNGMPVTLALSSGAGRMSGTLTQNTDATGKATFGDLRFNVIGVKTLLATAPGLTATNSVPFQILPVVGEQWTNGSLLLQLNGTNNLGPVIISASTNLTNWLPIYTNPPTNGPIFYLDTNASNYPRRFYRISE